MPAHRVSTLARVVGGDVAEEMSWLPRLADDECRRSMTDGDWTGSPPSVIERDAKKALQTNSFLSMAGWSSIDGVGGEDHRRPRR
jgi:hypothetical protein